jgi:hypothetical protein
MPDRIAEEMALLQSHFPKATLHETRKWVLIPDWLLPPEVWSYAKVTICFQIPDNYPGQAPYGFYVSPPDIRLKNGKSIGNASPVNDPPFGGQWLKFSWQNQGWIPSADLKQGSNLLNFVNTFRDRLKEGS